MEINITDLRKKLFDKLLLTGWDKQLRFFVNSSEMEDILLYLINERSEERRFSPGLNDIFKPFQLCHYDDMKVVLINNGPYGDPTLDDGLALSHKEHMRTVSTYQNFITELGKTVGEHSIINGDLSSWAKQGVLLLNLSLTEQIDREGKHEELWRPFTNFLWEKLNKKDNLILVFLEPFDEWYWDKFTNKTCVKIRLNPLNAVKHGKWDSDNVFNKINQHLGEKNISQIVW